MQNGIFRNFQQRVENPLPEIVRIKKKTYIWSRKKLIMKKNEQMRVLIQQEFRKCDKFGCGFFGASRGKRKHTGLDVIIEPEENVFSPIDGRVTKVGYCYNDDLSYRYVEVTNSKFVIRVLYIDPLVDVGDWVKSGDYLGYGQSLQKRYKGITDHIHVEIKVNGKFVDPELYLDNDEK